MDHRVDAIRERVHHWTHELFPVVLDALHGIGLNLDAFSRVALCVASCRSC
jgi:hypothetical protein